MNPNEHTLAGPKGRACNPIFSRQRLPLSLISRGCWFENRKSNLLVKPSTPVGNVALCSGSKFAGWRGKVLGSPLGLGDLRSHTGQLRNDLASIGASVESHKLLPINIWPAWQLRIPAPAEETPESSRGSDLWNCLDSLSGIFHIFPHISTSQPVPLKNPAPLEEPRQKNDKTIDGPLRATARSLFQEFIKPNHADSLIPCHTALWLYPDHRPGNVALCSGL